MKNPPKIFFMTDAASFNPLPIIARLPPSVGVIIRDYDHPHRAQLATTIRSATKNCVLVGKDAALASAINANGLHCPQYMSAEILQIRQAHPSWLITASAHSAQAAAQARHADIIFLSPVFPTASHPDRLALTKAEIDEITQNHANVYALGGVNAQNFLQLKSLGFAGLAAISAFKDSDFVATLTAQT